MEREIKGKIKYAINKGKSGIDICSMFDIEMSDLFEIVKILNKEGFACYMDGDNPVRIKGSSIEKNEQNIPGIVEYCFLSDLHLGSIYDRVDILRRIYAECKKRGVKKIFCSGDVTDGEYPDRPHYAEHQNIKGFDNMVYYVCQSLPEYQDITMYAISGNHDETYETGGEESILNRIAYFRKDFVYLGKNQAVLTLDDTVIRLMHGYSKKKTMDDRLENIYNQIPPEEGKPDILALGHIHTSGIKKIDDTIILQCGALMDSPEFVSKKLYATDKSCFFVKIYHDEYGRVINTEIDYISFEEELVRRRVKDFKLY